MVRNQREKIHSNVWECFKRLITNAPFLIAIEIYLQVHSYPLLENVSIDLWLDCYAEYSIWGETRKTSP